ncbi:MAG: amino acid carrier protein [Puniceicoccales bacterium]|nr:amino acid carrier protein [Puniceicoccales bacterium]
MDLSCGVGGWSNDVKIESVELFLLGAARVIWSWPLILFILAVGVYFSCKLRVLRISILKLSLKCAIEGNMNCRGEVSAFASLCTALSATLGTGNIVGMAVAVTLGGPGALFWLWISSIFSLAIKYAEGVLAVKYRKIEADGSVSGGPMYYIGHGLRNPLLAKLFAISGTMVALFGIGTLAQSNSIAVACGSFKIPIAVSAICLTAIVASIICGGLRRIATIAEKVVPIMTIFYIGAAIVVLVANFSRIPGVLYSIFHGAFAPESLLGGGVGISSVVAASVGVSRGIFSHESGLGSSAIAAAAAQVDLPPKQGFAAMAGALLSVVVCTMTGLVILVACDNAILFGGNSSIGGATLTSYAFGNGLGIPAVGTYIVGISIVFFAFTTIIGWNYYGEKCTQYVFGKRSIVPYRMLFLFFVAIGPFFRINGVFALADIVVGFMAISNLIGLVGLRRIVISETDAFFGNSKAAHGNDFHWQS